MQADLPPVPRTLAKTYTGVPAGFDEFVGPDGTPRAHWQKFLTRVDVLGAAELEGRWAKAQQLLHENGVSYNVYGDPQGVERPWNLSPIPFLLAESDWEPLEVGLGQRARLLDRWLADLYGPGRTLAEGLVPPEIILGNPLFLRACHGLTPVGEKWLPIYGADVIRGRDGNFMVLDDRTQAPSGAGYALENRIIISSILPDAFRECNVQRLASFFRTLRETLVTLAPHNRDNPRVVVLTAGPNNATYFEQSYLAQYLGYPLVNGADLTVRDDRVYLKTLEGLSPIDVIMRRLNDDQCDPLELQPDSLSGVPGLVEAARSGHVALANPLGTGLLQTPAILPYLERLCRVLLGEPLRLPSVQTVWCGEPEGLKQAEAWFPDSVVKPTFPSGYVHPIFTAQLSHQERSELWARIQTTPSKYVVQERVQPSSAPVLSEGQLEGRPLVLRGFTVASDDRYIAMPGGLSRVADSKTGSEVSMQLGAGSKDTWVISDQAVSNFSLRRPHHEPVLLSRGGSDLPSRAADNLYWLGRYAERAEGVARLSRVISVRLSELATGADYDNSSEFEPLLRALTAQTSLNYSAPLAKSPAASIQVATSLLSEAVFGESNPGSLKVVLRSAANAGRLVRDRISTDTWRVLTACSEAVQRNDLLLARDPLVALQETLNRVVLRLAAFSGLAVESMTRGHAWSFLDMGRRLERAMTLVTLLRGSLGDPCERESTLLEAILEVADSVMTYRRRYLANLQTTAVVDLLVADETNPRSVAFQIEALARHIDALPPSGDGLRSPQERITMRLLTDLRLMDVERVCTHGERRRRSDLSKFLVDLATRIPALSDCLSDRYLNHATLARHWQRDSARLSEGARDPEGQP